MRFELTVVGRNAKLSTVGEATWSAFLRVEKKLDGHKPTKENLPKVQSGKLDEILRQNTNLPPSE